MPDAKRRQVPISERGPGWTYRPATDPGEHQPGISTAHLSYALLAAYDGDPREIIEEARHRPEAVTIGFGAAAFSDRDRPLHLRPLPPFPGDNLRPELCGGDVCVLICSDDAPPEPLTSASPRWIHRGVRGDRGALGFREGTLNLRRPRDFEKYVWVTRHDRTSMIGGTYLVVRRIQVDPAWHALSESEQERIIGRHKRSGAPLTGRRLYDAPILERLPDDAHIKVAAKSPILRRGYDTEDGLLFLAFMNDPRRQYVALQQRLAERDALHPFTAHIGSALFAIPPRRFLTQPPV